MTDTLELIVYCSLFVFGVILFPVLIQTIAATDMTVWTFSGHEGVAAFLTVFPYMFIIAMILGPAYMIMRLKQK